MGIEIFWLGFAEAKLKDIYDYYSLNANKKVARKLISGVVTTTLKIENNPKIGPLEVRLSHRSERFRFLIFKHYKIIYFINEDFKRAEIVHVFDIRQDPIKINQEI